MRFKTTIGVWRAIRDAHDGELIVFGTHTDMDAGEMMTQWGFIGSDEPLIEGRTTWDPDSQTSTDGEHEHWIHST